MDERRFSRDAAGLAQRAYTLQPARSLGFRVMSWVAACMSSAVVGAAALMAWQAPRAGVPVDSCHTAPVPPDVVQAELERTRLALAQETAARGAVQKTADGAAADVARLTAELQFLQGQSKTKPAAATAASSR
ncbi:MAG TPA: hypothetical protein VEN30_09310 [Paraburkholderia sp.]|nr:hypothetical protein [Paraburkholderia sp.]